MNGHHYHYRTIIATWTAALLPWMSSTGTDHKEPPAGLGVQPAVSLERTELSEHTIKLYLPISALANSLLSLIILLKNVINDKNNP